MITIKARILNSRRGRGPNVYSTVSVGDLLVVRDHVLWGQVVTTWVQISTVQSGLAPPLLRGGEKRIQEFAS
jgi:hypothetical protein